MRYRRFGKTELCVSEVGFGCAGIGGVFSAGNRADTQRLLRRAFDAGITFFDTADMYTQGDSERLVGEAFRRDRERVIIATKFGYRLPAQKQLLTRIKPLLKPVVARMGLRRRQVHAGIRGTVSDQDFSPGYIIAAVEASLRRLNTDYIDVYQLHSPPRDVLERGEFVQTLNDLLTHGKIRYWGVACEGSADALLCLGYPSLASVQVGINALEQAAFDAAIPSVAERGLALIARQVFASGLLTRPVEAIPTEILDTDPQVAELKRQQLVQYAAITQRCDRSRAEMALKFLLRRPEISVVLLGISRQEQLKANLQALDAPDLSGEEYQLLISSRRPGR
jgi:aryl-alcohol dehydrogenase-like predicted oxidoreductase